MIRRVVQLVVSCVVLAAGVTLLLRAALGSDGYSTLINGLALWTGMPFMAANVLVGVLCVALAWARHVRPGLGTVVQPVVVGLAVDIGLRIVDEPTSLVVRVLLLLLAFPVLIVGVAGYLGSGTGAGPTEAAALAYDPPVPFRWSYSTVQVLGALLGWLMGGDVGVGTVLVIVLIGPAVDWLSSRFTFFDVHAGHDRTDAAEHDL